jgi:hypothetical protein
LKKLPPAAIGNFTTNDPAPVICLLPVESDCRDFVASDLEPLVMSHEKCIAAFDKTLTDLRAEGMNTTFILAALTEISAKVARFDPEEGRAPLDAMISVLAATAQAMRGPLS